MESALFGLIEDSLTFDPLLKLLVPIFLFKTVSVKTFVERVLRLGSSSLAQDLRLVKRITSNSTRLLHVAVIFSNQEECLRQGCF